MKERFNTQIEKELPGLLRREVKQHPLKKLFQEEEARIRQGASSGNLPPSEASIGSGARVVPLWRRLAAVAAVLLVVGFSGNFVWQKYFAEPPLFVSLVIPAKAVVQAGGTVAEENYLNGKEAYINQKYKRAVDYFQKIPASARFYDEAQFLMAHAYHLDGQFSKAIPIYRSFLENDGALMGNLSGENQREDNLRCNLVLAFWGNNQLEQARSELKLLKALPSISNKVKNNIALIEKKL